MKHFFACIYSGCQFSADQFLEESRTCVSKGQEEAVECELLSDSVGDPSCISFFSAGPMEQHIHAFSLFSAA